MNEFARLSATDRVRAFEQTAARRGLGSPVIIEKDFWVCWSLRQIFSIPALPTPLFKGGTSLSKAYGLIQRFSEDVDIVIDRHTLGFTDSKDSLQQAGRKHRKRTLDALRTRCEHTVQHTVLPLLDAKFKEELGHTNWTLEVDSRDPQCLIFGYPAGLGVTPAAARYLQPVVRLEFGCRGDVWPSHVRPIQPYVAETFPQLFSEPTCDVSVLAAERTFWEKATLLHAVNHSQKTPERLSRHYYDISRIYRSAIGQAALSNTDLLTEVVKHKTLFFPQPAASYETARPGSLRMAPTRDLEAVLRRDWRDMQEMLFEEAPTFDEILADIRFIEAKINGEPLGA